MSPSSASNFGRSSLFVTVFLTGASVMVIELLGTRMLAPFYGTSLYVWSSLISVTMIALALGYYIGGRWADSAKRTGLALIIAMAGLLTLMIPWLTRPILLATDPLGLRAGAFASALILFSPSLTLLGMVGPFAIKIATSRIENIGNSVGSFYAISTLGSVVGTMLLGFFLFPMLGSREILVGTGILLFVLAFIVALLERNKLGTSVAITPIAILIALGLSIMPKIVGAGHVFKGGSNFQIQSEHESLYGWVRVIDQPAKDLRLLTSDASAIGATSIATGGNRLTYQDIVGLIPAIKPNMKRALVIGLGVGHMAKVLYERYGIVTDTLEIDPAVSDAATQYFGFKPTGKAIIGDARYEIRHLSGPYDLIIHDCFTGGSEPSHLLTVETLKQLQSLLTEQGILSLNFVAFSQGDKQASLASVAKTIAAVYPHQTTFISEPGKDFNDFIFLASDQVLDLEAKSLQPAQVNWLKDRVFAVDQSKGMVLTDNFNPLEHMQTQKAEHYRNMIVELLGPRLLVR
ncbi:fused MFS/spermidine synthase [Methylomonas sp. AM2-LC]|uniref:fused MFS/spermidine synthase n=1 Tax=Methylomonas sp. AM2-LC TaxID=3153301 RepID=UPI003267B96F